MILLQSDLDAIAHAKELIDTEPDLAVFMVRDLPIIRDAKLLDLAWSLAGGASCHRNDAVGFFEMLDAWIQLAQVKNSKVLEDNE